MAAFFGATIPSVTLTNGRVMGKQSASKELLEYVRRRLRPDYWIFAFKRRRWIRNVILATLILFFLGTGGGYYYLFHYTGDLTDDRGQKIDFTKLARSDFRRASYVYASNGAVTGRFFEEVRDPVRLDEVPDLLQKGFIAAEDQRFYTHPGVDPIAITRASVGNILRWFNIKYLKNSGASSIPQQYTRLIYAEDLDDFRHRTRSWARKRKEAKISIQLVKRYPREKIFEGFLNMIYFGHGVNGVAEASERYFGKNIRKDRLNLREIAILVSLNKSPTLYCPIFHKPTEPDLEKEESSEIKDRLKKEHDTHLAKEIVRIAKARERYNWVLSRMRDEGFITEQDYQSYSFKKDEPLELEFLRLKPLRNSQFAYANRLVKEMLLTSGHTEEELSESGGLRIYTPIDLPIQQIVSDEFVKHLKLLNQGKEAEDRLNGAFVVMEVQTGNILALSGGHNFDETQYNRVFAPRSPGSAAKLFTFAGAMEYHGKGLFDQVCNCPLNLSGGRRGQRWIPQNFEEKNPVPYGHIDLSKSWYRSVNLGTLNLAREIGMEDVVKAANAMGVWGNPGIVQDPDGNVWFRRPGYQVGDGLVPLLPTAIGASEVNLIEMASAFTVFFRGGTYITPTLIREVRDTYNNKTLFQAQKPVPKRTFSKDTSDKIVSMMRAVTKIGTAKISMRNIEQQVACKTGTSDGPRDTSIYCGSPEIFIAFWFGRDNYEVISIPEYMKTMSGDSEMLVSGGWVAGPLARKVFDRIYSSRPKVSFNTEVEGNLEAILNRSQN